MSYLTLGAVSSCLELVSNVIDSRESAVLNIGKWNIVNIITNKACFQTECFV